MKTAAVMMVRDEVDVIEGVVLHALDEVDAVYVLDNGSTDGTRDILDALADHLPVAVYNDPERGYYQSEKLSHLAERAGGEGYGFIVPMDADEIWTAGQPRLRDLLPTVDAPVVAARLLNHICTGLDVLDRDPFRAMVWRKPDPGTLPKVAFRWEPGAIIAQGNHSVHLPSYPEDDYPAAPALTVHHFQVRSPAQFVTKILNGSAAYAVAADLPAGMGNHWRAWGELLGRYGEAGIQEVFDLYFWRLSPVDAGLVRDPAPYRVVREP